MQTYNAVKLAQLLLLPRLSRCNIAIDATAGKGRDSLFLAANTPESATIYSFDIQKDALKATQHLLQENRLSNKVRLVEDNHKNLDFYVSDRLDVVMFNLGYLPGAAHDITTHVDTTLIAVKKSLNLLTIGGFVSIIAYPGHAMGELEFLAVESALLSLPSNIFAVNKWVPVNKANKPPVLFLIEKVRSELA